MKHRDKKANNLMTQRVSMSKDFIVLDKAMEAIENVEEKDDNAYKCICKRKITRGANPCSNYCAFLTPKSQKEIILSDNCKVFLLEFRGFL